ncbi:MAG: tryptophan 7-halogenase [Caldilineaceae bacterium]|nr:tryptophan 7-halogenase [Caldilineaceae bacterium]
MEKDLSQRIQALPAEKREQLAKLLKDKQQHASPTTAAQYDVIILGGGLAGGTLAQQLKRADPTLKLLVIEKRQHPVPEAAHKVGESSVEMGSHYLRNIVGAKEHLETVQLPKSGLRFFFPQDDNRDITQRVELGCTSVLPVSTHQIDRGRFENMLHDVNERSGIDVWDKASVKSVDFGPARHSVTVERGETETTVTGRWVVDAAGRGNILKRKLGLKKESSHNVNAVWFRFDRILNVADWSDDPAWQAAVPPDARRFSTTHLMGRGYWVWLIPLYPNSTSVGIVADAQLHPHAEMNRFEKAVKWLETYEPQCAEAVKATADRLQDFCVLRHYAHDCQQVFSADRWCLTGEAGVFVDPFYSPGSDFIGLSNTIVTTLILKERRGESIAQDAELYNRFYLDTFHSYIGTYENQYPLMGNAQVMTCKVIWDFSIYWGVNALIFFHNKSQDLGFWTDLRQHLTRYDKLNVRMQEFFRAWDRLQQEPNGSTTTVPGLTDWSPTFVNYMKIPYLHELHTELVAGLNEADLKARVIENIGLLEVIADEMYQQALRTTPMAEQLQYPVELKLEAGPNGKQTTQENGHNATNGHGYTNGNKQYLTAVQSYSNGRNSEDVRADLQRIWLLTQTTRLLHLDEQMRSSPHLDEQMRSSPHLDEQMRSSKELV